MSNDEMFRAAAVVAALAILAAPCRQTIASWITAATEAAAAHRATIGRITAAVLLIAAASGKITLPSLPDASGPFVVVDAPSAELQQLVAPISSAASFSAADKAIWAATWTKAGVVVAGDAVTTAVVFTDTRSLREYTALALDIAWRRIGKHQPGSNEPLRKAVEAAYDQVLSKDVVSVTADVRSRYIALSQAIAWAGTR